MEDDDRADAGSGHSDEHASELLMSPTDMIRAHLEENGPSTAVQLRKALGLRSQTIRNCISGLSRKKGGIRKVGEVKQRIGGIVGAAMIDVEGTGYVAGRTAARLNGLDSFDGDEIETLVRRSKRAVLS